MRVQGPAHVRRPQPCAQPHPLFCPSTNETESKLFLEQELSDLLLLHIYILQSGRCSRMARSMLTLARSGQSGALHNMT